MIHRSRRRAPGPAALASVALRALKLLAVLCLAPAGVSAFGGHQDAFCSTTAKLQSSACGIDLWSSYLTGKAICRNIEDADERSECFDDLWAEFSEEKELCGDQLDARLEVCDAIGEERYDPDFDPADFESDFANPQNPNPYYPLPIEGQWAYEAEGETDLVTVRDATKDVEGVTCIVVHDVVTAEDSVEDTNDWLALASNGDVWYCGEESKDYELFEGDVPQEPELVSIEGSFKHGRDGDKAGILFLGNPTVGTTYRQEYSLDNAEDVARVLSTTYGYGQDEELDELVPQALAEQYCPDDDCVVTLEFTPIEPDIFERKYHSRGVGVFLETNPEEGTTNVLVGCNVDPKCSPLP